MANDIEKVVKLFIFHGRKLIDTVSSSDTSRKV